MGTISFLPERIPSEKQMLMMKNYSRKESSIIRYDCRESKVLSPIIPRIANAFPSTSPKPNRIASVNHHESSQTISHQTPHTCGSTEKGVRYHGPTNPLDAINLLNTRQFLNAQHHISLAAMCMLYYGTYLTYQTE